MRKGLRDLALFGGNPLFDAPKHVGAPNLPDRAGFYRRLDEALDRRWLTNRGPLVSEFEERVANITGTRHCIATCNGTIALEILLRAIGVVGEAIMPSLTFVATAHAVRWQEVQPRFADIAVGSYTMDPEAAREQITPRTSAIVGVHLWGQVCDVAALRHVADQAGLPLVFDAAHAFGCSRDGRMVGSFGKAETFSFHATKFINTFEGGAIVTDDDELAERCRFSKNFGFAGEDEVAYLGINGKMSEVSAAMGLAQLDQMEQTIEWNRNIYEVYKANIGSLPGVSVHEYDEGDNNNYQYIVIELDQDVTGIARDSMVMGLKAENILARRYFYPGCHRMQPYASEQPHAGLLLSRTEAVLDRVITLPTGTAVSADDAERICSLIRDIVSLGAAYQRHVTASGRSLEPLKA